MITVGACLMVFVAAMAWLARQTTSSLLATDTAAQWLVALSVPVGLIYVLGLRRIIAHQSHGTALGVLVVAGLAMRAVLIASPPLLEDDFYRYLWDGAVTAHGVNPYHHSPRQVLWASVGAETVQPELLPIAAQAGSVLERVNHPHLTTIYPPVAQAGFAVAYALGPWSTGSWRLLLLIADGLTLLMLFKLLSNLRLPAATVAWYWWNPILLRELYGAAHMDALLLPFLMGAVWLAGRKRFTLSMLLLSLAGGVKLWPLVLAPLLLRPLFASPRRLLLTGGALLASTLAIWAPTLPAAFGPDSGFLAYATEWQNNAGAFTLVKVFVERTGLVSSNVGPLSTGNVTRLAVIMLLVAWIVWHVRRPIQSDRDMLRRCFLVVAGVFLLSPTQFPWYFVWVTPFLAITPNGPILTYSALLPLYHLRAMHPAMLWVEHAPVWLLLICGFVLRQRRVRAIRSIHTPMRPEVAT